MVWKRYMSSVKVFIYRPHNQYINQIILLFDEKGHSQHTVNVVKPVCGNQMKETTLNYISKYTCDQFY